MADLDSNFADFTLAERCLHHEPAALAELQRTYRESVTLFLRTRGAEAAEAAETVDSLWSDLLRENSRGTIPLARYHGSCTLQTWLNTVAMNALLTRKRVDGRREAHFVSGEKLGEAAAEPSAVLEYPLIPLLREAVEQGFASCGAEEFVLLQLEHYDQLERGELALLFNCSKSTISRMLDSAKVAVRANTLAHLRQRDPWLELRWEDFLELCRVATLSCLGGDV